MSTQYKQGIISRLRDTRSDLARLLVEHPDKDLLAIDFLPTAKAGGFHASRHGFPASRTQHGRHASACRCA